MHPVFMCVSLSVLTACPLRECRQSKCMKSLLTFDSYLQSKSENCSMTVFFWHSSYLAHVPLGTVLKRDTQCNDQWKNPAWFLQSQFADHFDRPARQTPCEVFASSSTHSLLPLNTSRRGGTSKGGVRTTCPSRCAHKPRDPPVRRR